MTGKTSNSSIKILEFLKMLYDGEATYDKVSKLLATNNNPNVNSGVTLNKYLNTLKIFGITVKKRNQKFTVYNSPYSIELERSDLKSIILMKNTLQYMSKSKAKTALNNFLDNLIIRLDGRSRAYVERSSVQDTAPVQTTSTRKKKKAEVEQPAPLPKLDLSAVPEDLTDLAGATNYNDLTFYFSTYEDQVGRCEKMCDDNYDVEVSYSKSINSKSKTVIGSPVEVKYSEHKIFFVISEKGKNVEIPISRITHIRQLPVQAKKNKNQNTVMFKVKGNLAKAYKLRENETGTPQSDGTIIISNTGEDYDKLLIRLMRYQDNCEILQPKFMKERMYELINSTLELYKY